MLTSVDGIGSRRQDLRAEFWISCLTSRTDSNVKVRNDGTDSSRTADMSSLKFKLSVILKQKTVPPCVNFMRGERDYGRWDLMLKVDGRANHVL